MAAIHHNSTPGTGGVGAAHKSVYLLAGLGPTYGVELRIDPRGDP